MKKKTEFIFMRHAEPDYTIIDQRHYRGFGNDLAPITQNGIQETINSSKNPLLKDADIIISSPYTRTMQTASVLSKELNINLKVEIDLMEWIPDKDYMYNNYSMVVKWRKHYDENDGKCTYKEDNFEEKTEIISRVKKVLKKYNNYTKVIVITHGMVINALTNVEKPNHNQIIKYILED